MEQRSNEKKEITGLWIFPDADVLEDYFLKKAAKEQKLGRTLTEPEAIELLVEFKKAGEIDGILVEGNKGDVKAVLTEHLNCKVIKAEKREDNENV